MADARKVMWMKICHLMCSMGTLATLTKAFNKWMLEMPIREAASLTLIVPGST